MSNHVLALPLSSEHSHQNMGTLHNECFKLKKSGNGRYRKDSLTSADSPETSLKTLLLELPSLYLEERNIVISRDRKTQRGTGLAKFPPVNYPFLLSYFSMTVHSSSNLIQKLSGLSYFRFSFPYKGS